MKNAAEELATVLDGVNTIMPEFPVIQNVSATNAESVEAIRDGLKKQLFSPVLWVKTINSIVNSGATQVVEIGPGKVLTGLAKRINRRFPSYNVEDIASLEKTITALNK